MRKLIPILFLLLVLSSKAAQPTVTPLSGFSFTNNLTNVDRIVVGTGIGTANEHLQSIAYSNLLTMLIRDLQQANSTNNGVLQTNDQSMIGIRNANHALFKKPVLGYNTYAVNGNFGNTESNVWYSVSNMVYSKSTRWYKVANVDDAWMQPAASPYKRSAAGNLQISPTNFPSGEANLLKIIHTNGLYGIKYLAVGDQTAGHNAGSKGYWYQDVTNSMSLGWDGLRFAIDDTQIDTNEFVLNDTLYGLPFMRNALAPLANYSKLFHVNATTYNIHAWQQGMINEIQYSNYRFPDGTAWHDQFGGQTNSVNLFVFYILQKRNGVVQPGCYFSQMVMGTGYTGGREDGNADTTGALPYMRGVGQNNRLFGLHAMTPMSIYPHDFDYDASYKYVQTNDLLLSIHQDELVDPGTIVYSNGPVYGIMRHLAPAGSNRRAFAFYNTSYDSNQTVCTINISSNLNIPGDRYLVTDVFNYAHTVNESNSISATVTNDQLLCYMITPAPKPYAVNIFQPLRNTTNGGAASNWFTGTNIYGQYIPTNDANFAGLAWWSYNYVPPTLELPSADLITCGGITNRTLIWNWTVMCTNRAPFRYTIQMDGWNADNSRDTITGTSSGVLPSAGIWNILITNACTKVYAHQAALFGSYTPDTGGGTNGTFLLNATVFRAP